MKTTKIILALAVLMMTGTHADAKKNYGYTEDHPLIVACDWDFQPYEFMNNEGRPSGYNVEVLSLIFERLAIPHKFMMQEWYLATEIFERHEADLIHALSQGYTDKSYVRTKNYINYYNVKLARRLDTPPLRSIRNLGENDTLMLKKNDYAALRINQDMSPRFIIKYTSPKEGLTSIRRGHSRYFIWGEIPLTRKIKELSLDSVIVEEIDVPAGELRMIAYDHDLIDAIDDEYARLEQSGDLQRIRDRWFHPERVHADTSPFSLFILIFLAIVGVIALLFSRLITLRVRAAVKRTTDVNNVMRQALSMGDYFVMEFDVPGNILRNKYGDFLPAEGMLPPDFLTHMPPDQAAYLHEMNLRLAMGKEQQFDMHLRFRGASGGGDTWRDYYGNALAETDHSGRRTIIYTVKDTTDEVEKERAYRDLGNKYRQVFETNLLAMSYFDANGRLIDMNDKMRELCELDGWDGKPGGRGERFFRNLNLFESTFFCNDYSRHNSEVFHCCLHLYVPELRLDKYVETHLRPVCDDKGEIKSYIMTSRDVSAERKMYMEQQAHDVELLEANRLTNEYEGKLHYLLEECKMFIWHFFPETGRITFSRSLRQGKGYEEGIEDFFSGICEEEREEAMRNVLECIEKKTPYHAVHRYDYTPVEEDKESVWYSISGIPVLAADGSLKEFFGLSRNITDLMEAQQQLLEETSRAENSGRMKAAFLANMTHEIRTPLNAIVGFSDILQMVDTAEERKEFIRIIRNNCDMLLRLINDILEASSMGQSLAIKPVELDLSQAFDDICLSLEQRVQESGVQFIKDNPYPSYRAYLDRGRLQQVLTNFVTNAVKYTHEGHVKVGYREEKGGLLFYCEDTGAGIPKEKQAAVFERFIKLNDYVQGTGLGLSICKSICERCGGKIGVHSEGEGYGSTFWMWIPRHVIPYQTIRGNSKR